MFICLSLARNPTGLKKSEVGPENGEGGGRGGGEEGGRMQSEVDQFYAAWSGERFDSCRKTGNMFPLQGPVFLNVPKIHF